MDMSIRLNLCRLACGAALGSAMILAAQSASDADKKFVKEALQGGNDEVQLGKLAQEKGSSPDVKNFGQKMVTDHSQMGEHMTQIAQQIGVSPPSGTSMSGKTLSTKLHALSGDSFDKSYIQAMVEDHKKDLAEFKQEAANGSDPAVKAAAERGAKVIAAHLQLAEQIAKSHNIEVSER
jgi:putative membrane protein